MLRRPTALVIAAWLVLAAIVVGVEAPPAGEPGLNYDEAFLAQQARDFLEPDRVTVHPPSERSTYVFGRRFPLRNAAYLGGLKSQLLIPAFALFGPTPATLRLATLATALTALLFTMLWARRVFGVGTALLGGLFVALDPSFVFFGACEWGPYTTLLLCRSAGLFALTAGWQTRRTGLVAAGALALGLGVYARADFAMIDAALAVGVLAVRGRTTLREIRERPGASAAALAAVVVGSLPMLRSAIDLLAVESGIADRGDLAYRAQVLWSTLDGSYYYRVLDVGGLFERIFEAAAPASVFGFALVLALPAGAVLALQRRVSLQVPRKGLLFLVVTTAVLGAAMLALPGAVRAHHMLNLMPFTHLLVATVIVAIVGSGAGRVVAAVAVLAIVTSSATVTARTRELVSETGGRGRYSNALDAFAAELDGDSERDGGLPGLGLPRDLPVPDDRAPPRGAHLDDSAPARERTALGARGGREPPLPGVRAPLRPLPARPEAARSRARAARRSRGDPRPPRSPGRGRILQRTIPGAAPARLLGRFQIRFR